MAFPPIYRNGFETGAHGATSSSGTLIDFPHYTELARAGMAPYRGSYCERVRLAGGTTSQYIQEDTAFDDLDAAGALVRYLRWYFYLGRDMVFGASDKFSMVEIESSVGATTEVAAGIQITSGNVEFWYNETTAAASPGTLVLGTTTTALGKWFHAELQITYDDAANNNGSIIGYINDGAVGATVGSLDQADVVDVRFGVIGPDAGTSGTFLIDDIIYDDTGRIYRDKERFPTRNRHVTFANDHPIVGPGCFSVAVTGTGIDAVLSLYDSDGVPTNLAPIAVLRNLTANEFVPGHDIFEVQHGLYTVMSGTAPQAFISLDGGAPVMSQGQYVTRGLATRLPRPK